MTGSKVLQIVVTEPEIVASSASVYDRQLEPRALWNILVRNCSPLASTTSDVQEETCGCRHIELYSHIFPVLTIIYIN